MERKCGDAAETKRTPLSKTGHVEVCPPKAIPYADFCRATGSTQLYGLHARLWNLVLEYAAVPGMTLEQKWGQRTFEWKSNLWHGQLSVNKQLPPKMCISHEMGWVASVYPTRAQSLASGFDSKSPLWIQLALPIKNTIAALTCDAQDDKRLQTEQPWRILWHEAGQVFKSYTCNISDRMTKGWERTEPLVILYTHHSGSSSPIVFFIYERVVAQLVDELKAIEAFCRQFCTDEEWEESQARFEMDLHEPSGLPHPIKSIGMTVCWFCHEKWPEVACDRCGQVLYCSASCATKDWDMRHSGACKSLADGDEYEF